MKQIKNQPIDVWFFFLFLLTFTLGVRKVTWYFPIKGAFNEYTGIYVYISDIFLFLAILVWIASILYNTFKNRSILLWNNLWITCDYSQLIHNTARKSVNKKTIPSKLFHLPRRQAGVEHLVGNWQAWSNWYTLLPLLMVILSFISIGWSENKLIALFRSIKLVEYILLYFYLIYRIVPRGTFLIQSKSKLFHVEQADAHSNVTNTNSMNKENSDVLQTFEGNLNIAEEKESLSKHLLLATDSYAKPDDKNPNLVSFTSRCSTWNNFTGIIIFIAVIQSIISIVQFMIQHSIGLFWLKESLISPTIPGVAKIILNGHVLIRSYGLFPHPNILGGFLLFSIILTLLYKNVPRGTSLEPNLSSNHEYIEDKPNGYVKARVFKVFSKTWFVNLVLIIQLVALLLTFSKSAILGLVIALICIIVPRGTINNHNLIRSYANWKQIILGVLILALGIYLISPDWNSIVVKSWRERFLYLNVSRGTILDNPIFGVGVGQFIVDMQNYANVALESWQYQPVHNVFLEIWSELGLIGLILFLVFLYKILFSEYINSNRNVSRETLSDNDINKDEDRYSVQVNKYYPTILVGLIFIMLFDHYLWDIQQGSIILWMTFGFIVGMNRKMYNENNFYIE